MNFGRVLILLVIVKFLNNESDGYQIEKKSFEKALKEVIFKLFEKEAGIFDVISYGNDTVKIDDLMESVLAVKAENFKGKVQKLTNSSNINASAVLIFDSLERHLEFSVKSNFSEMLKFLVLYTSPVDLTKWKSEKVVRKNYYSIEPLNHLKYQTILAPCGDSSHLCLWAPFRFSKRACNAFSFEEINRFSAKNITWLSDEFRYEVEDIYGCTVRIYYIKNTLFHYHSYYQNGKISSGFGYGIDIINILSKELNFKLEYLDGRTNETDEAVKEWQPRSLKDTDFFFDPLPPYLSLRGQVLGTHDEQTFLLPYGEPYTAFEKLLLPFDETTWMLIGLSMGIGVLTIIIIKLSPIKVQKFVFGSRVSTLR